MVFRLLLLQTLGFVLVVYLDEQDDVDVRDCDVLAKLCKQRVLFKEMVD